MPKKVTMTDVAKACGVSQTLVSFVLNGRTDKGVSDATREKVLSCAKKLGYTPNLAARLLRSEKSGCVGLSVLHPERIPGLFALTEGLCEKAKEMGLSVLLAENDLFGAAPASFRERSYRSDGMILLLPGPADISEKDTAALESLRENSQRAGFPLLFIGGEDEELFGNGAFSLSSALLCAEAVKRLCEIGAENIGFVKDAGTYAGTVEAFAETVGKHGVKGTVLDVREVYAYRNSFDAFIAGNAEIYLRLCMEFLRRSELFSEKYAVISLGVSCSAGSLFPAPASVSYDLRSCGAAAPEALLGKNIDGYAPKTVFTPGTAPLTDFVKRRSRSSDNAWMF